MKLSELILEKALAPVYQNTDKTLTVISNLIEKYFRVITNGHLAGPCLFVQAVYTVASVTGIPYQDIANSIKHEDAGLTRGLTLEDIFELFKKTTIKSGKKKYKVELGAEKFDHPDQVIKEVSMGQPIVMVVRSYTGIADAVSYLETRQSSTGKVSKTAIAKSGSVNDPDAYFHALLIIGYDRAEKYLIGRDIRTEYGYRGYFKIHAPTLAKHPNAVRFLAINVEKVEEVKNGRSQEHR